MKHARYQAKSQSVRLCAGLVLRVLILVSGLALLTACGDLKLNTADIIVQSIGNAVKDPGTYGTSVYYDFEIHDLYLIQNNEPSDKVSITPNESLKPDTLIRDYPYKVFTITWMGEDTTDIELRGSLNYSFFYGGDEKIHSIDNEREFSFISIQGVKNNASILVSFSPYYKDKNVLDQTQTNIDSIEKAMANLNMNITYKYLGDL